MSTMARRDQLSRLLQVLIALKSGHPNARDLSALCEVSLRTIYRDLASLELAGVPIRYRAARHGYELAPSFVIPIPRLTPHEALALLVTSRFREVDESFLGREARAAIGKVLAQIPEADQQWVEEMGQLLELSHPPTPEVEVTAASSRILFEGLTRRRRVRTWFTQAGSEREDSRVQDDTIGPFRLVHTRQAWHVIGQSEGTGEPVVALELGQIRRTELTDTPYVIPPESKIRRYIGAAGLGPPNPPGSRLVRLRLPRAEALHLDEAVWHLTRPTCPGSVGDQIEISLTVDSIEDFARSLPHLGTTIEILSPDELQELHLAKIP